MDTELENNRIRDLCGKCHGATLILNEKVISVLEDSFFCAIHKSLIDELSAVDGIEGKKQDKRSYAVLFGLLNEAYKKHSQIFIDYQVAKNLGVSDVTKIYIRSDDVGDVERLLKEFDQALTELKTYLSG